MNTLALYCDGLCEPTNPGGWACWAWLAKSPEGRTIRTAYGCLGHGQGMSNNLAEYEAVLQALRPLRDETRQLAAQLCEAGVTIAFVWVPREQNEEADALSRQAYREARQ